MLRLPVCNCFVFKLGRPGGAAKLGLSAVQEYYKHSEKWSVMRRNRKNQPRKVIPISNESPAILNLIEQLDRDLKEGEGKPSKAQ
jgi:hypothetical protein